MQPGYWDIEFLAAFERLPNIKEAKYDMNSHARAGEYVTLRGRRGRYGICLSRGLIHQIFQDSVGREIARDKIHNNKIELTYTLLYDEIIDEDDITRLFSNEVQLCLGTRFPDKISENTDYAGLMLNFDVFFVSINVGIFYTPDECANGSFYGQLEVGLTFPSVFK